MGKGLRTGFVIAGIGVGAGCMYLMDPDRGRSRRAVLRGKSSGVYREVRDSMDRATTDLTNRAQGMVASLKSMVQNEPVGDDQLVARVRARLGRLVSHPHAIEVTAHHGRITLSGDVLEEEAGRLVAGVGSVRGVSSITDHLLRHREASNIPSLQGGPDRRGENVGALRHEWPPALRMLAGVTGGSLGLYLLARGIAHGRERIGAR